MKTNTNSIKLNLEIFIDKYYKALFIIAAAFLAFICFWKLGQFPVADWDESRHGVSAYEMMKNHENIINTYNYQNDYWNLKPSLSFNFIIIAFKILGTTTFAFRIPSAIAMFLTGIILAYFIEKKYGKLESIISLIAFSVCTPLYMAHTARNGDADALFILFFTIAMIAMLLIDKNKKALYICSGAFALAFLTKSWHAFVIVAIGGLFLLLTGEIKKIKLKEWLLFILTFTVPIGAWVVARVLKDGTKFLVEMLQYDLLKRSSEAIEGNKESILYYFKFILLNGTSLVIALGIIILIGSLVYFKKWELAKNDVIGYSLWIILPLIVFTIAKTKLAWYIIPIYIPLIIVGAIFLGKFLRELSMNRLITVTLSLIFGVAVIYQGYITVKFVNNPKIDPLQDFMVESFKNNEEIKSENAYIDIESEEWRQSQLLIGELYGDLKCKIGGVKGFSEDKDAVLITKKTKYLEDKEILKESIVISETDDYIIIRNIKE